MTRHFRRNDPPLIWNAKKDGVPMMRAILGLAFLWVLVLASGAPVWAQSSSPMTRNAEVSLHPSRSVTAPGDQFTLVLRQSLAPGWHVYWRNHGDSGAESSVEWTAPAGLDIGAMQFPTPKTIPVPPLMTYGYEGEVLYPISVRVPRTVRPGETLTLSGEVATFVCAEVCVREDATVTLAIPVASRPSDDPVWAPAAVQALAAIPKPERGVEARLTRQGAQVRLTIAGGSLEGLRPTSAYFFPYDKAVMRHNAPQAATAGAQGLGFTLTPGDRAGLGQGPLEGVLRVDRADGAMIAIEVRATPGAALAGVDGVWTAPVVTVAQASSVSGAATNASAQSAALGLGMAALFAFIGGLILNVMPCVFPVLSMKAIGLARAAHSGQARRQGVLFFAGVMTTFLALAGLLLAMKAGGQQIGWGFQLQEPLVAAALALVFFVIGLNLLGMFEVGGAVQNLGAGLAGRGGDLGAFFTGALAVVAASPCTAPFMAGAIGFASTASTLEALTVFAALGVGFGLPFTALAFAPGLLARMPKPGAWMDLFKQIMAFPMFAAAIWMAWVVAVGTGANGALGVMVGALATAFLIWAFKALRGQIARTAAAAIAAGVIAVAASMISAPATQPSAVAAGVRAWSAPAVEAARSEGKGVFVNFTAAWCVTCKVNEMNALERPRVKDAFAKNGIVFFKGDWTRRDEAIAQELARFGRNGVPLYLYYPPGQSGEPKVLPEVLTEEIVLAALSP